jgi:hypothetical protein
MKKWIGALCSGLAGILSIIFLAIPAFVIDNDYFGSEKLTGWDLLTGDEITNVTKLTINQDGLTALTWYRIFVWVLVVLSIILIIIAVLQILSNLKIVRLPSILTTITKYALIALAVVSLFALIANFGIRSELVNEAGKLFGSEVKKIAKEMFSTSASLWLVTIVNVIIAACANIFVKSGK